MVLDTIALNQLLRAEFLRAAEELDKAAYRADIKSLAMTVPSSGPSETYGWLGDLPEVKEWIGDKELGDLESYSFEIKNRNWTTGIRIDRNEIEDAKVDVILPRVRAMPQAIRDHYADLIAELIENGITGLAYDGQAFFANRAAPNDNLLAGSGVTVANLQTDLNAARVAAMKFASERGKVLGVTLDTVVCPAELEFAMLQAINSDLAGAGGEKIYNPLKNWFTRVIALPGLSDESDWYAFCTTKLIKPFVLQMREEPRLVLDDSHVAKDRKLDYSAEGRHNAGYGLFQLAVKVVNG